MPKDKITLSRQGIQTKLVTSQRSAAQNGPIKFVFLGRLEPVKGVHVLIEAIKAQPSLQVELDIYGIVQNESYAAHVRLLAASEARIRFLPPLAYDSVINELSRYDALVVPSTWLETGPLVVLEAFAAGIPIIGSDLGGIAELVTDGQDGILIKPGNSQSWQEALAICKETLTRLRSNVRPPRGVAEVAAEMTNLYLKIRSDPELPRKR